MVSNSNTRLCPTTQEGRELSLEKPELKALVSEKLGDLHRRWEELETTTQAKARSLFDANRAELFAQSCSALESWLLSLQAQLHSDDYGKDLTSVNILLKKQQVRGSLCWSDDCRRQERQPVALEIGGVVLRHPKAQFCNSLARAEAR